MAHQKSENDMKIDIHTHTRKIKTGDSENRDISPEKFDEIIRLTNVRIVAITNHNFFDLNQFSQIDLKVRNYCQIWPGVELDIFEDGRKAHLIIIVSPQNAIEFNTVVADLLSGKTPDTFKISIEETVKHFDKFNPIYIAHYHAKKPNLIDDDVDKLISLVSNQKRVLKEATNSISAGIYISHGHNSIYGSDIQNWNDYPEISKTLPDLRLPVESFEQFCLLLEKDNTTINTYSLKGNKSNNKTTVFLFFCFVTINTEYLFLY